MPFPTMTMLESRREFVQLAQHPGTNLRELCRRFGITAPTAYKWLRRYEEEGTAGLENRSRRPHHSPAATAPDIEEVVVAERDSYPARGGRKLRRQLQDRGVTSTPSASTITAILRRHGRLAPEEERQRPFQRFEHPQPNGLWQMDFMGHFAMVHGRCHSLTVIDDCSRYLLVLAASADQRGSSVRHHLTDAFQRYGLPAAMLMDNGSPWGDTWSTPNTPLTVWLLQLGITVIHSRPYHPQTAGKVERAHRTIQLELVNRQVFQDITAVQRAYDHWRHDYNHIRPHEALDLLVPAARYQPSAVRFPAVLESPRYDTTAVVRRVASNGRISFRGHEYRVGKGFRGHAVEVRPTADPQCVDVLFAHHYIRTLDLAQDAVQV